MIQSGGKSGKLPETAAAVLAILLIAVLAGQASAFTFDARSMAMGEVTPPGPAGFASGNFAYTIVPPRDAGSGLAIPIPLGLIKFLNDMPPIDPEDEDFDPMAWFNLLSAPPFHLELNEPEPLDGDIILDLGLNHLSLFWEDAEKLIPSEPFDLGTSVQSPALGLSHSFGGGRYLRVQASPYLYGRLDTQLDDALYGVLAQGEEMLPNSSYTMDAHGRVLGGLAWSVGLASRIEKSEDTEIFLGASPKLISAFGFADAEMAWSASTGDTLFSASNPVSVDMTGLTRYTDGVVFGKGFGLDLGVVVRHGPFDFGLGLRDLGASVRFSRSVVQESSMVENAEGNSEMETITVSEDQPWTFEVPMSWVINGSFVTGDFLLACDLRVREWENSFSLGGEWRFGKAALRAGLRRDLKQQWQVSGGVGLLLGRVDLNLALAQHSYIQDGRGLALGLSLNIHRGGSR